MQNFSFLTWMINKILNKWYLQAWRPSGTLHELLCNTHMILN